MADLDGRSRGQIILVAAFALAVIFITLALIVNSAIFTQNLASRGETSGADDALSHRAMVEENVGENVEIANRRNNSSQSDLREAVEDSIENTSIQGEQQQVTSGTLTSVSGPNSITYGSRVVQKKSGGRTFEDADGTSGNAEWTVLTKVQRTPNHNGTRAFRMNVSELPSSSNSFVVTANGTGGSGKWIMKIDGDVDASTSDNEVNISVDADSTEDCTIEVEKTFAIIDVTSGTVNGKPCDSLRQGSVDGRFAHGVGNEYNITFDEGARIEGNYSLTANRTYSAVTPSSTLNSTVGDSPYVTRAIYNVTVGYAYQTSGLYYETDIRVAPGEPDA